MRVLHVLNPKSPFSQLHRLGDSSLALKLVKALKGITENTIILNTKGVEPEELKKFTDTYGAKIVPAEKIIGDKRQYQKPLFEYIRSCSSEYDIIHLQQAQSSVPSCVIKYLSDVDTPVLFTNHTPPEVRTIAHIYKKDFVELATSPNRALVAVSNSLRERLSRVLEIPEEFIYSVVNGVETPELDPIPLEERTYDFIVVGRIDPLKNTIVNLNFCLSHSPDSKILFIGDTFVANYSNKGDSDYVADTYKILEDNKDRITHIKSVPSSLDVFEYLRDSKIYVNLSPYESGSLATLEAMRCGTPVLGVNSNSVGEFVDPGVSGYLLDLVPNTRWTTRFRTLSDLAIKCLELDPIGVRKYAEQYSMEKMAENYYDLYVRLLKKE